MSEENFGAAGSQESSTPDTEETVQEATLELKYSELKEGPLPTFRKKPELVDARQFTGGLENATDLCIWLNLAGFKPGWESRSVLYTDADGTLHHETKATLTVEVHNGRRHTVNENGWIIYQQDGSLETMSEEKFNTVYEQV